MADMMDEIGDDLRRQQLEKFWKENGSWIIGGILLAVVATAALSFWRGYEFKKNAAETAVLLPLIDATNPDALAAYALKSDRNHALVARFAAANLHAWRKETAQADAIYRDIEGTFSVDRSWSDLARLLSVSQRLDRGDPAALHQELAKLTTPKNIWRFTAMEMDALLYARENKMQQAADVLAKISGDAAAPGDTRTRAMTMRELYLGAAKG